MAIKLPLPVNLPRAEELTAYWIRMRRAWRMFEETGIGNKCGCQASLKSVLDVDR